MIKLLRGNRHLCGASPWLAAFLASSVPLAAQEPAEPTFSLGFGGFPADIAGAEGEVVGFDVLCTLTTEGNPSADGAQGWSISLGIEGGTLELITLEGVMVSTIYHHDHDDDETTPPIILDPYEQDLGKVKGEKGFAVWNLGFHSLDPGRQGAVSAVVLRMVEKMVLQPGGTGSLARLRVSVPVGAEGSTVRLYYEDGFRNSSGMWTANVITWQGASLVPRMGEVILPIHSLPPVPFRLGDVNQDGLQDISDPIATLDYLFLGGAEPDCRKSMDLNGDNALDLSDPVFLLGFLFLHTQTPREPYRQCGLDPLPSRLTCVSFAPCAPPEGR